MSWRGLHEGKCNGCGEDETTGYTETLPCGNHDCTSAPNPWVVAGTTGFSTRTVVRPRAEREVRAAGTGGGVCVACDGLIPDPPKRVLGMLRPGGGAADDGGQLPSWTCPRTGRARQTPADRPEQRRQDGGLP
jgi:hypothetical protein